MNSVKDSPEHVSGIDLEELYNDSPVGSIVFKYNGTILFCNKTLCSWLELRAGEDISGSSFLPYLQKSGKLYFQMFILPLLDMQSKVSEISLEINTASGNSFSCLFYANAVCINQEKLIHATIVKIADRKKFEAQLIKEKQIAEEGKKRLEFLANSVANLLFTVGQDGHINFVNERFYKYFNYTSSELEQFTLQHLVHPLDVALVSGSWKSCFKDLTSMNVEARLVTAHKGYEWFLINIVPYIDESGKAAIWFGSCTNINEQKEKQIRLVDNLNEHLSAASQLIAKNEESFKEIAFYQSHVVRLPLANILGIINLFESMEMNDEYKELFALLHNSARQLDDSIKSIVDITHTN